MASRPTLEAYALELARAAATRSEDPHRKVGAALLGADGRVLATGYNGPPAGVDLDALLWTDRDLVRQVTIHAEANALRFVRPGEAALLATTLRPCLECVKAARAQGVSRIVYADEPGPRWELDPFVIRLLGVTVEQA